MLRAVAVATVVSTVLLAPSAAHAVGDVVMFDNRAVNLAGFAFPSDFNLLSPAAQPAMPFRPMASGWIDVVQVVAQPRTGPLSVGIYGSTANPGPLGGVRPMEPALGFWHDLPVTSTPIGSAALLEMVLPSPVFVSQFSTYWLQVAAPPSANPTPNQFFWLPSVAGDRWAWRGAPNDWDVVPVPGSTHGVGAFAVLGVPTPAAGTLALGLLARAARRRR